MRSAAQNSFVPDPKRLSAKMIERRRREEIRREEQAAQAERKRYEAEQAEAERLAAEESLRAQADVLFIDADDLESVLPVVDPDATGLGVSEASEDGPAGSVNIGVVEVSEDGSLLARGEVDPEPEEPQPEEPQDLE